MKDWSRHQGPGWNFTPAVREVVADAQALAHRLGAMQVEAQDLGVALFTRMPEPVAAVCRRLALEPSGLREALRVSRPSPVADRSAGSPVSSLGNSRAVREVWSAACEAAEASAAHEIGPDLLLLGLVRAAGPTATALAEAGLTEGEVVRALGQSDA